MARPPISVSIPTKNSADKVETALESVADFADEIVVLDSDSTDGTVEICESYGARVEQHEFEGFAHLRRAQLDAVSNDWILFLSADEELSPELHAELLAEMEDPSNPAYDIRKEVQMFGVWVTIGSNPQVFFGRTEAIEITDNRIHEIFTVSSEYEDAVGEFKHPIYHYTYDQYGEFFDRLDQYTSLEALEKAEAGTLPNVYQASVRSIGVFLKRLLLQGGIADGFVGLFFAVSASQYELLIYGKSREIRDYREQYPDEWQERWAADRCQR